MPSSITVPEGQLSRRDKFRAYMQAFNPTAPVHDVIQAGLVVEDLHHSLYRGWRIHGISMYASPALVNEPSHN